MKIQGTSCCAVYDIEELRESDTAQEAMMDFCRHVYGTEHLLEPRYNEVKKVCPEDLRYNSPDAFYMFTAVVGHKNSKHKPTYGPDFAKLIENEGLGELVVSKARPNRMNHPDHLVKVWIWTPAASKVKAWYVRELKAANLWGREDKDG